MCTQMFSFKRSGSSKKGTDSNTSLHGGEKGEAAAPSDPGAAPIEPPTPSPYHPDKSATLPLVVENSPTTTFSASEVCVLNCLLPPCIVM